MGYTHYFTQPRSFTPAEMMEIGDTVRRFINEASGKTYAGCYPHHKLVICDANGEVGSKAVLTAELIAFNGTDDGNMGHETFAISADRDLAEGFCKTARKPYDVVVVATLAYCAAKWGFKVESDGDVSDWETGVALAQWVTGEPIPNPLIVNQLIDSR